MKGLRSLLLLLLAVGALCVLPTWLLGLPNWNVAFPVVTLAPEHILTEPLFKFLGQSVYLNNTLTSVILTDIVLLIMAVAAGRVAKRRMEQFESNPKAVDEDGNDLMVPKKGWHNTFEALVQYMYDLNEQIIGAKWAKAIFPLVITFFTFILVANWLHFLPINDSVGLIHCAEPGTFDGWDVNELGNTGIYTLNAPRAEDGIFPEPETGGECPGYHGEGEEEAFRTEGVAMTAEAEEGDIKYFVSPFFRTATTDLSLTLALSIVAMIAVQIYGVRELGMGYFSKFINLPALGHGPIGFIEFIVGFLELISEFLKVVSFALRLLGNIFAGTILLFVMMFLVPVGLPLPFFLFEVLIGALQAFVFAMLIMVFTSVAQIGHGDHDDDEHH